MLWPEIRSAYWTRTQRELAKESLDIFVGYVLEYEISRPEHAHRTREALMSMAEDKPVEGATFDVAATSMLSELDRFELERTKSV